MQQKPSVNSKNYLFEHWTDLAINCWEHQCICTNCSMKDICDRQKPNNSYNMKPMKYTVMRLMQKFGKPSIQRLKEIYSKGF